MIRTPTRRQLIDTFSVFRDRNEWPLTDSFTPLSGAEWRVREESRPSTTFSDGSQVLFDHVVEPISLVEFNNTPSLDGNSITMNFKVGVSRDHRRQGEAIKLLEHARDKSRAVRLVGQINPDTNLSAATREFLDTVGCTKRRLERIWKPLSLGYDAGYAGHTPSGLSAIKELFAWLEERQDQRLVGLYFDAAHSRKLRLAEPNDVTALARMRLAIAKKRGYSTSFERVEHATARLIEDAESSLTRLFVIEDAIANKPIATARMSARFNVEHGCYELEIRDTYIKSSYRGQQMANRLLPGIVLFASELVDCGVEVIVSTLAPPKLARHWLGSLGAGWRLSPSVYFESK